MNAVADHLTPESWEQMACDELSGAARALLLAHIEACPECRVIWSALSEVRAEAEGFDPALVRAAGRPRLREQATIPRKQGRSVREPAAGERDAGPGRRPRRGRAQQERIRDRRAREKTTAWRLTAGLRLLAGLAAGTILTFGLLRLYVGRDAGDIAKRGVGQVGPVGQVGQVRAAERSVPRMLVPSEGDVVRGEIEFSWQLEIVGEPMSAEHSEVEVLDAEGELVWLSDPIRASRATWPAALSPPRPGVYYWRVVTSREGERLTSELVRFQIAMDD